MAELENKVKLEGWSCKLTKDTKETLTELQNSGDFATVNQMMETLIERYYSPIKAQDQSERIAELLNKIAALEKDNEAGAAGKLDDNERIAELERNYKHAQETIDLLSTERDQLEQDVINATVKGQLPENGRVIIFDPLNWKILEFVAEREGKKRNQEWTPEDVINFFVHHRFEKGDVNGGFRSVPDNDIKKMKDELNAE